MSAAISRVPMAALTLLTMMACESGKVEVEGETDTQDPGGDTPTPSSPYEADSRAGCTYDLSWDEHTDGNDQWWSVTTWDPRVNADGDEYITRYVYETELADTLSQTYSYDDLLCRLSGQEEETVSGVTTGVRTISTCDAHGRTTSADTDSWDGAVWTDDTLATYTNAYDESGRLIERIEEYEYSDGSLPNYGVRYVYTYEGDLLQTFEYYLGTDDDDDLYYSIEYQYGDDTLVDTVRLVLGDYFGYDVSGTLYVVTDYTWDARGNLLTRDYENVYSDDKDEHSAWTWDEHDRLLTAETWSDSDGTHTLEIATWDEAYYRHATYSHADLIDPTQDYTQTFSYDGGWPWAGTASRDYADESMSDGTFSFAYTCD